MLMPTLRSVLRLVLLALLALPAPGFAGAVEVRVVDENGEALSETTVTLTPAGRRRGPQRYNLRTNLQGRARFEVPDGMWVAEVQQVPPGFVPPNNNPYNPPPVFTVRSDDDNALVVDVVLQRGIPVEIRVDGATRPNEVRPKDFAALFKHRATNAAVGASFRAESVTRLLVPGAWEVEVKPRPGVLLVGVEHNGNPIASSTVSLDLEENPFPVQLVFTYRQPASIYGAVTVEGGEPGQVSIVAQLDEPGDWINAARARGGSQYERVSIRPDRRGNYEMTVPDGRWRVFPVSQNLVSSVPPEDELVILPGEDLQVDFAVTLEKPAHSFMVTVGGKLTGEVRNAWVEILSMDGEALRSGRTTSRGRIRFPVLPEKDDYLLVAGHRDYLETQRELLAFDSINTVVTPISLEMGAGFRLQAQDAAGEPMEGVELVVERREELPELRLKDPLFLSAKQSRTIPTDLTGRARANGFYPGLHEVRAVLPQRRGQAAELLVGEPGTLKEKRWTVHLEAGQMVDLEARLEPSAMIELEMVCEDGGPLPDAASVRVYDAAVAFEEGAFEKGAPLSPNKDGARYQEVQGEDDGAVLVQENVLLKGQPRQVLRLGPLAQGTYRLAVRPAGFSRWTWAFGTTDAALSDEIQILADAGGEDVNLGLIGLECGPAADVVPLVVTGQKLPGATLTARAFAAETETEYPRPSVGGPSTRHADREKRYEVRRLPEGPALLDLVLAHPCLMPYPSLRWQVEIDLQRGNWLEVAPRVEAVGGAVRVHGEAGLGTRLHIVRLQGMEAPAGTPRKAVIGTNGRVIFPSLEPGRYRLEICADRACRTVDRELAVDVRPGRITDVDSTANNADDGGG